MSISFGKSLGKKLGLAIVAPLVMLGLLELVLRLAGYAYEFRTKLLWHPTVSGFMGTFEFYIPTFLAPPGYIWVSQANTPLTDRFGFRLPELALEKPDDKYRVAFLGGSTTHGGFRPYPERAIRLLNSALDTNRYEALNVACSSYSTHQSRIALERWVLPRKPDMIFLYHGWNDMWVAGDGYADKEKDALVSVTGQARMTMPAWMANLRLARLLGRLADAADRNWPRQRVSFDDFEANLEAMAQLCQEAGVPMLLMIRPEQRKEGFVSHPVEPLTAQYAKAAFGVTTHYDLYKAQSDRIIAIQRAVAARHDHVTAFDGHALVMELLDRADAGEFGEGVSVFYPDNVHLMDFADELLAQQVALALALPHDAEPVRSFIGSPAYLSAIAHELVQEESPRESLWFIDRAMQQTREPEAIDNLTTLRQQAEANFEFVDLFRKGRWGGSEPVFENKVAMLRRCLEIRPSDYGVMIQLNRVCYYMDRMADLAEPLSLYSPQTDHEWFEAMSYLLESHLAGQRWFMARQVAEALLPADPQNPLLQQVIREIPAGP